MVFLLFLLLEVLVFAVLFVFVLTGGVSIIKLDVVIFGFSFFDLESPPLDDFEESFLDDEEDLSTFLTLVGLDAFSFSSS